MGRNKIGQCTECGRHMRSDNLKQHSKVHAKARNREIKKYEMKNGAPVVNRMENHQANESNNVGSIPPPRQQHSLLNEGSPSIKVQKREENTSVATANANNDDDAQRKVRESSTQTTEVKDEQYENVVVRQDDFMPEGEFIRKMFFYAAYVLEWTDLPINDVYKLEQIHIIDDREAGRIKDTSDAELMVFLPQAFLNRLSGTKISHFRRQHRGEGFDVFQLL